MKTIGLDIGTTTICGVLLDGETGLLLGSKTLPNTAALPSAHPWERCQSPAEILRLCKKIIGELAADITDLSSIGVTGQMHGMLYLDAEGTPLSPLYSWQDGRGDLPGRDGRSYAQALGELTGYPMATGYGLTTHYYNLQNGLVPSRAACICTIGDYVAAALARVSTPLMHSSNAASLGLFDLRAGAFDQKALAAAGIDPALLPPVTDKIQAVGYSPEGRAVTVAVGDNQASFLGSVADDDSILVNVGTSSQISVICSALVNAPGVEARPLLDGELLAVGSPLCGGDAYATLRRFFEQTAQMMGCTVSDIYFKMNSAAAAVYDHPNPLTVSTQFRGTRQNPALRGSITNIDVGNFTPAHLTLGVLRGICEELYGLYTAMPLTLGEKQRLVGSGNAIRKNMLLQRIFSDRFGMTLMIPLYEEEAAFGMSLMALCLADGRSPTDARRLIQYQQGGEPTK